MPKRKPTELDRQIGRRIRQRRKDWDISPNALAAALNISVQQVHKYETGKERFDVSTLSEISWELGVPIGWFFTTDT